MIQAATVLSVATTVVTAVYTALRYSDLPERVPMHFGLTGRVDGMGPRPAIWLLVAVEAAIALTYGLAYHANGEQRMLWIGFCAVALTGWLQSQIVSIALAGANRMPLTALWAPVLTFIVAVVAISASMH